MHQAIKQAADTVLSYTTRRFGGMPGVVAMATNRYFQGANFSKESFSTASLAGRRPL
jgi:hypothetical protein